MPEPKKAIPPAAGFAVGETIYSPEFCKFVVAQVRRNPRDFYHRATKQFQDHQVARAMKAWNIPV